MTMGSLKIYFLELDEDFVPLHAQLVYWHRRLTVGVAGFGFDLPTVPGADNFRTLDDALAERAATMRTHIVEGAVFAVHPDDADRPALRREFLRGAFRR